MLNRLSVKILVPTVALMLTVGALLDIVVLRTVDEFARNNIENDLENLNHELFSVVDNAFMQVVKNVKAGDKVAVRIGQVDCLDILERLTYSHHFKLIVFEKQSGSIRLESALPRQANAAEIIQRFQARKDDFLLETADGQFHVRQFYFSPWDWSFLILKNTRSYAELSQKVHRVYQTSAIVLFIATTLLIIYLLGIIKNPIASIISSISQGKSPDYRGTYEFEFLSRAISEMRSSMKASEQALQKVNKELEQRVKERIKTEVSLRESEKRFRDLTENSSDWIWEVDENLIYTYASPKVKDLLGYDPEEVVGKSPFDLMPLPESYRIAEEISGIIESHQPIYNLENINLHKDGKLVTLETNGVPLFDNNGNFKGYRGIDRDISDKKVIEEALRKAYDRLEERVEERTLELKKTYNQLLHAEKLATSGSIAASLAHEFGNPLYGIKGVLNSIAQQETLPEDNVRMVVMAMDECDRMSHLLQSLQDFNRPTSGEKTLTNLNRVIDDIVIFSRRNLERKDIVIKKDYDPVLRPIMVITDQIKQVVINLINNSIYACAKEGLINISTSAEENNVIIRIKDNGHGIKEDDLPHIFEPFFTTKDIAMGTGLGLSVSYGIIRRHRGTIAVASKPGEGATFTLTLPTEDKEEI